MQTYNKNSGGTKVRNIAEIMQQRPHATADIMGSADYPDIQGTVWFYQTRRGVLVSVEVTGLPAGTGQCDHPVLGFHIHSGSSCTGNATDPFANAMTHLNADDCPHPYHMGDLPPLFVNHGYAFMVVLTDRFMVNDILGKTIIIHSAPDDFTTQPAGNSGNKIACGVIREAL